MASILHLDTDTARSLASSLKQAGDEFTTLSNGLVSGAGGMDWTSPGRAYFDDDIASTCRLVSEQAAKLQDLAQRLESEIQQWETAAASLSSSAGSVLGQSDETAPTPVPVPVPTPEPTPGGPSDGSWNPLENIIRALDDLLKPIDWISDSTAATRKFNQVLEDIGRALNGLTGQRGHIKMMGELGDFLRDTTKAVGFLDNILDLRDMNQYFAGNMTNSEVAMIAIKALVPIPGVNDRLAQWAVQNMVDPNGHWSGLVRPAY